MNRCVEAGAANVSPSFDRVLAHIRGGLDALSRQIGADIDDQYVWPALLVLRVLPVPP